MNFDPTTLNNFVLIGTAYAAAFVVTLWVSLIIWAFRDVRRRSKDPFARILAILVVTLLFLPGFLIYLILRPSQTIDEEYQQTLEEEALLQTIEDIPLCPGCTRRVKPNWIVCPTCQTKLKKRCHHCGEPMELAWNICPVCATAAPGMRKENLSLDEALSPISDQNSLFNGLDFDSLPSTETEEEA